MSLRFGIPDEPRGTRPIQIVLPNGQFVRISFEEDEALAVHTPLIDAPRTLDPARLRKLLSLNVPSAETAGATVAADKHGAILELVHWFGFHDIRPEQLPDLVLNQGEAAFELNKSINDGKI